LLDEFQIQDSQPPSQKPPLKGSDAGFEKPDSGFSGDDNFAAQLQHGMTDLLREMNDSVWISSLLTVAYIAITEELTAR
jgi:hypothetical protein